MDDQFGPCGPPTSISDHEHRFDPPTLSKLDAGTGGGLKGRLDAVLSGQNSLDVAVWKETAILWAMDCEGNVFYALEHVVDSAGQCVGHLQRRVPLPRGYAKLGHPTLLGRRPGRIAGEIFYDHEDKCWYISNKSGRYGLRETTTEEHLVNVANLFNVYELDLRVEFYQPPKGKQ